MKLHQILGTGMIIAGGVTAGMYGTGCVDHDLKLRKAAKEVYSLDRESSQELKEWRDYVPLEQKRRLERRTLCILVLETGKPVDNSLLKHCEDNETEHQQREEGYNGHLQILEAYNAKLKELAEVHEFHSQEFWSGAKYAALGLLAAAAGYAVRRNRPK